MAAKKGDARAFYNLGKAHAFGIGVRQSWTLARRQYEKAFAFGDPDARAKLDYLGTA